MSASGEGGLLAVPPVVGFASLLVVGATAAMPALAVATLGPVGFLAVALVATVSLGYVVARFETYHEWAGGLSPSSTTAERGD